MTGRAERDSDVFDVAVVGAGPAGAATARWLARDGWRVATIERGAVDTPRVGESLAPTVQESLRALGVWSEFLALEPLPSWGTRSVWGDSAPQSHSHLASPYGCGWHVDRPAFDGLLAAAAARAGAAVVNGQVCECRHDGEHWRLVVRATTGGEPHHDRHDVRARVVIDATGRRAQIARALGSTRLLLDHLVGVSTLWAGVPDDQRSHLLVESSTTGWWYSAPLPKAAGDVDGRMIAVLMTDADLCAAGQLSSQAKWSAALHESAATRARLGEGWRTSTPRVHSAVSHRLRRRLDQDVGPWLAVGDAALAVDPVSGSGILRALRTARAAAEAAGQVLRRRSAWRQILAAYERDRDEECTQYLVERAGYYASEQRFDTPFWRRRHSRPLGG